MTRPYQTKLQQELINLLIKMKKHAPSHELATLEDNINTLNRAHIPDNDPQAIGEIGIYIMYLTGHHPALQNNKIKRIILEEFQADIGLTNMTKNHTKKRK